MLELLKRGLVCLIIVVMEFIHGYLVAHQPILIGILDNQISITINFMHIIQPGVISSGTITKC